MAMTNKKPSYDLEHELLRKVDLVFGMDEVGRGSFAGPLVAAAVCFTKEFEWFKDLNDSKLLTPAKREELSKLILENSKCFIEIIKIKEINQKGIGKCNQQIFDNLIRKIQNESKDRRIYFLIDGGKQTIKEKN